MSPTTTGPTIRQQWMALAVLMFPVLLVSIDNTVLAFALPMISTSLGPTGAQQLWIVDVYPLVLAALLVTMGSLGDRIGRRRLLLIGSTGFAVVSAVAAYAPSAEALVGARAALGFFGAMLMPSTLSLIRNIFVDARRRRLAIAVWAAAFAAGAALGPIVGGLLLEHFWWGSVFLMAVPILVPLLVLAPVVIPESRDPHPGRIDPISIGLSLVALTPLVFAIKAIAKNGVSATVVLCIALSAVAITLFVRRQLRSTEPMLDVRLFTNPVFAGAVAMNLLSIFALVGFLFFVSQHLQLVAGLSPLASGLLLVPGLIAMVVSGLLAVRLTRRHRPAHVVTAALLISALSYAVIAAFNSPTNLLPLTIAFIIMGAGIGAAETISNDLIVSSAAPEKAGAASAVSESAYELGAVTGTAVLGSVVMAFYGRGLVAPDGIDPSAAAQARETLGGAHEVAAGLPDDQARQLLDSAFAAFDDGVLVTSVIAAGLMVVAAVVAHRSLRSAPALD